jgi:hypothetical protein
VLHLHHDRRLELESIGVPDQRSDECPDTITDQGEPPSQGACRPPNGPEHRPPAPIDDESSPGVVLKPNPDALDDLSTPESVSAAVWPPSPGRQGLRGDGLSALGKR